MSKWNTILSIFNLILLLSVIFVLQPDSDQPNGASIQNQIAGLEESFLSLQDQLNFLSNEIESINNQLGEINPTPEIQREEYLIVLNPEGKTIYHQEITYLDDIKEILNNLTQTAEPSNQDHIMLQPSGPNSTKSFPALEHSAVMIDDATSSSKDDETDDEPFEPLFDAFDAQHPGGWIIQGLEKAGPKVLENNILNVGGWDYWAIISKKTFDDFILTFDAKFVERSNSGILIHTPDKEIFKPEHRIEIQLNAETITPFDTKSNGAIERFAPPLSDPRNPLGEWDSYEIKYQDRKIWVTINGTTVQDGFDLSQYPILNDHPQTGHIAIQRNDYKKEVLFRDLRVKRLQ